jgi:hypothetical protein
MAGDKAFKYPACRECNAVLSACPLVSLKERRRYLFNKFIKRHKKLLNMPNWELSEIAELEGFVKNFVMESFRMRPHLIARMLKLKRRMK